MSLFNNYYSITGLTFFLFTLFIIVFVGYLLGGIKIKGVSLGTAGVFIISLVFGMIFCREGFNVVGDTYSKWRDGYNIIQNIGLLLFVTAVGFIAGPNFFSGLKKNFKSYILLGLIIIVSSGIVTAVLLLIDKNLNSAMATGLLSGALTSTPAFSASLACLPGAFQDECTAGHGIAYLFGVVGVVLFVQLVPKFMRSNMEEERSKIVVSQTNQKSLKEKLIEIDGFGLFGFGLAVVVGILVGSIKIPLGKGSFSLGTTGGPLIMALVFGHFYNFGKVRIMPDAHLLSVLRELGLMLFLIGAGVPGGANFLKYVEAKYFIYGAVMTTVPMFIGFFFAKFVLKMPLLNNLGSITGGMTSTPALGTLISVSKTDDVANAYAATYPIALVSVVVISQLLILIFPC